LADIKIEPRAHMLASSQLSDPVMTAAGPVHKPAAW